MRIAAATVLLPALALVAIAEAVVFVRSPLPVARKLSRALAHLAAAGYVAWILSMTLFPLLTNMPPDPFRRPVALVPLADIRGYLAGGDLDLIVHDLVGNLLVFVPIGILFPLVARRLDSWRGVLLGTAVFSLAIEAAQHAEGAYRVASTDDVILNVLGGALGFGLLLAFRSIRGRSRNTDPRESRNAA